MTVRLVTVVAAALFDHEGRVLLAQRPPGKAMAGLWEFPGGKIEIGETPERALARELNEELGLVVNEDLLRPLIFASHAYDDFHLLMPLYGCWAWSGELEAREAQAFAWVPPEGLKDYPAPAADGPLFEYLASLAGKRHGDEEVRSDFGG
ncbi:MAG: (deoxy)nucleoside triphosphate pyrophosphohydrolase [Pseudomonadota bacterium]